jgi:hypothetical protein
MAETGLITEEFEAARAKDLLEAITLTEDLDVDLETDIAAPLTEEAGVIEESFVLQHLTPLTTNDEIIIAGWPSGNLDYFQEGTLPSTYDTDDEDFGAPNVSKTLAEVTVESHRTIPHSVELWVSVDSGRNWTYIESQTPSLGHIRHFYPWIAAEKFRLRFRGYGLFMSAWEAQCVPRGTQQNPIYLGAVTPLTDLELEEANLVTDILDVRFEAD